MRAVAPAFALLVAGCHFSVHGVGLAPRDLGAVDLAHAGRLDATVDQGGGDLVARPLWAPVASGLQADLEAIWGDQSNDLFIVGQGGVILHSTDGAGASWSLQSSQTTSELDALWGTGPSFLVAAGANQIVRVSTDDGTTWSTSGPGSQANAYGAWGSAANDVYLAASSYEIEHSSDGQNWSSEAPIGGSKPFRAVWGADASHVIVVGDAGEIVSGQDGDWNELTSPTTHNLLAIFGVSLSEAWIAGAAGTILHSINLDDWQLLTNVPTANDLHGVWQASPARIFVVGNNGTILHSTDGVSFTVEPSGTTQDLRGVFGIEGQVWAVGTNGEILARRPGAP